MSLTPAQLARIEENSRAASAFLYMCSIHVTIGGEAIVVYSSPSDALDTCLKLKVAGATEISLYPGTHSARASWHWAKSPKRMRNLAAGLAYLGQFPGH